MLKFIHILEVTNVIFSAEASHCTLDVPPIFPIQRSKLYWCKSFPLGSAALNEVVNSGQINWDAEEEVVSGMTSIAICGIEDPVRPEVGCNSISILIVFGSNRQYTIYNNINCAIDLVCSVLNMLLWTLQYGLLLLLLLALLLLLLYCYY